MRERQKVNSVPPIPSFGGPRARLPWLTFFLLLILALDVGLLLFALDNPFDGFHGIQEAWYAGVARNYASHSFLEPTTSDGMLDLNVPPLFSYLVWLSFKIFGESELSARLVPVCFALLTLLGTYLLGRTLMRKESGLEAAALLGSTPIFLILGRSVQTDILFVCLSLFYVLFYMKARKSERKVDHIVAGLFLGTALFSKQFAVVPLAAVLLWEALGHGRVRLVRPNFMIMLAVAGLVLAPFYGYHLVQNAGYLLDSQLHGSASKAGLASGVMLSFIISEMLWGCSPLFFMGALAGLGIMMRHRSRERVLAALMVGCFFLFYLFLHRHSYYFFGMTPFLAMCFTELSTKMSRRLYSGALVATAATAFLLSAYQLAGCKYGFGEMEQVGRRLRGYERPVVLVDESFYFNNKPLFHYYAGNARLLLRSSRFSPEAQEVIRGGDRVFSFSALPLAGPGADVTPVTQTQYGLRLRDAVYVHNPPNLHFFTPALPARADAFKIISSFGPFVKIETVSFFLISEEGN
ncbi:MAG: hypothetical protein Kow0099_01810 [Candidatus Abyssubacteria bacterium]